MDTSLKAQVFTLLSVVLLLCSPLTASAALSPTSNVSPDDILMRVNVDGSGDAHWTIEYRTHLDSDDTRDAFNRLQDDIRTHPDKYEAQLEARMNSTLTDAEERTGRNMSITNVTVETETTSFPQSYGVVRYEFEWHNFAATANTSENRIISVGDALSGFFVNSDMRLVISWPKIYDAQSITPNPDSQRADNEVVWEGPISFGENEPRISLVKPLGLTTTTTHPTPTPTPTAGTGAGAGANSANTTSASTTPPTSSDTSLARILIGVLVLAGATVLVYRRTTSGVTDADATTTDDTTAAAAADSDPSADETTDEAAPPTDATDDQSDADTPTAESAADETGDASDTGTETETDADTEDDATPTDVDFELLSNEEQVMHLLDTHDGRIKQQEIVDETGWSASKTSNVVNDMKDDGQIDVFRLGRENIVSLPDEDDDTPA